MIEEGRYASTKKEGYSYKVIKNLGEGAEGRVDLCMLQDQNRKDVMFVAVKVFKFYKEVKDVEDKNLAKNTRREKMALE